MARALAILVVLGGLYVFVNVYTKGVDNAFGGAIAHFWKGHDSTLRWPAEPVPRRTVSEGVEREGRPLQPIGQRVRERVNRAMDEGERRYSGEE